MEVEHGDQGVGYLMQSGPVSYYVFEELDKYRKGFEGLKFNQFLSKMNTSDLYFNDFKKYLFKNGLDLKLDKDKNLVKRYLTAEFARQLFGEQFYYQIILKDDAMIKKAVNLK